VINTDRGYTVSNSAFALLQGAYSAGIPTINTINSTALAPSSNDPSYATNNVETVVPQGAMVTLGGSGFDTGNGVAVDLFCACAGGKVGPFLIAAGTPGLTSTRVSFMVPATGSANSPPNGPGSFVVSNAGAGNDYARKSNAVSVPIGEKISVASVTQSGSTVTVNGTGFSTLTVINFFNIQGGIAVNLGGRAAGGAPKIPLTFVNSSQFTFIKPAGALPGASYVQALNAPFVPYTCSGTGPGGQLVLQ